MQLESNTTKGLEEELGKVVKAKDVASFLGLDINTVRLHYEDLGGIRLGRRILFFENLIVETIRRKSHAVQEKKEQQDRVGGGSNAPGQEVLQGLRQQERGAGMGGGNKIKNRRRIIDPYGLLDPT